MKFWKSAVVAAVASLTFGGVANAQNLRLLASWDSSSAAVSDVLMPFVQKLENDTTAGVKIQIMGPETVPPGRRCCSLVAISILIVPGCKSSTEKPYWSDCGKTSLM